MNLTRIINGFCENKKSKNNLYELVDKLFDIQEYKILDTYPYKIENNEKFAQVENYYDMLQELDFNHNSSKFKAFQDTLNKFENIIKLLWLKNSSFYCCYICDNTAIDINGIEIEQLDRIKSNCTNDILIENIEDYTYLISLVRLALCEKISLYFIMPIERIILASNGLNFIIYNDQEDIKWLEKIVNTEGLYIR